MTDSLQDFLQELADAGDTQGTGSGFTLRSDKAREKLKKFALAHPENYFLLIIAGLHALGGRRFSLQVDADDLKVRADCLIERENLANLWESVAGAKEGEGHAGLRLLGLAVLTSVRFGKVDWTIDSGDGEASYRFRQLVRGEELSEPLCTPLSHSVEGTVVGVKRRDIKTVASRFFSQLTRRMTAQLWEEERLLSERVFLGTMESFQFNGRSLDCRGATAAALVALRVGEGVEFFTGKHLFREQGELNVVVVLGKSLELPGEPKKISWLWHGLTMGDTRLGLSYDFCRVFALADDLRCDLSLTSVADTWARQKAVRLSREAVRRALELLAQRYGEIQQGCWETQDQEMEEYLLEVLVKRIDVRRNRHRMGSFNDQLIRCPFFRISPPDGVKRRANLFEIWEWIEKGENPALFREESEWRQVAAWPDRPVFIFAGKLHSQALIEIFGEQAFHRGTAVAQSIEKLVAGGTAFETPEQLDFSGEMEIGGYKLNWVLEFSGRPGVLTILRNGRIYYEDRGLALPEGFHLYGEAPWEPNFAGGLADQRLVGEIAQLAPAVIAESLSERNLPPGSDDYDAMLSLIRALGPDWSNWLKSPIGNQTWLVMEGARKKRVSPREFAETVGKEESPFYYTTEERSDSRSTEVRQALPPHLIVDSASLKFLPPEFHDVQGVELLEAREPYSFPAQGWLCLELNRASIRRAPDDLKEIRVGFPELNTAGVGEGVTVEINLRGHKLQTRSFSSFVGPAVVCLELTRGWPDSRGRHLLNKEQMEALKSLLPDILTEAGRQLWKSLSAAQLERLHPEVQRTVLIDIWSEGERDFEKRVLTADGGRVALSELRNRRELRYFSDWSRAAQVKGDTVFLSVEQVEALKMVAELEDLVEEPDLVRDVAEPSQEPEPASQTLPPEPSRLKEETTTPAPSLIVEKKSSPTRPAQSPAEPRLEVSAPDSSPDPQPEPSPLIESKKVPCGPTVQKLGELFRELQQVQPVPFAEEFELFLLNTQEVEELERLLKVEDRQIYLRAREQTTPGQLLALLSALYSCFNHSLEQVEDSHERAFHQALLRFAVSR